MKKLILAVVALLLTAPLAAQVEETFPSPDPEKTTTGDLQLGVWSSDLSGSPDVVSRYSPADKTNGLVLFSLKSNPTWGAVDAVVHWLDKDFQRSHLDFDVNRRVRSHTSYRRFLARLGHDPLTYAEAATTHGRVLYHTDTDPEAEYRLDDGILVHRTEAQLSAVTLGFNFRDQRRKGAHQTLNVSHCDACHVVSQTRPIDETQQDIGLDAKVGWKTGFVDASYTHRKLREDVPSIDLLYDRALHPELRTPIFDNRVQFDALNGPVPVDYLQDTDKNIVKVNPSQAAGALNLTGNGVWSTTENLYTNNKTDYQGYFASVARPFANKKARFRFRGRYYQTDTSDVFFDTFERESIAGPHAGKTYRDVYGIEVDYLRKSSLNRNVWDLNADVSYRFGRKAGSVTAQWKFKDVDREHYEVAPGSTRTTTNILGVKWRPRPARGLRFDLGYRHAWIDDPYLLLGGACSNQVTPGPLPSPFHPDAAQYYTMRDARIMDTAGSAGAWDEVKLRGTYSRKGHVVSGLYRHWDGTNGAGNLTEWSRSNQTATLTYSYVPGPTWDGYVSYNYQKMENATPTCVSIFDG